MPKDGIALRGVGVIISTSRRLRSIILNMTEFNIQRWTLDVRCWTFISFFSNLTGYFFLAGGCAET
jgi:hypothetical protein